MAPRLANATQQNGDLTVGHASHTRAVPRPEGIPASDYSARPVSRPIAPSCPAMPSASTGWIWPTTTAVITLRRARDDRFAHRRSGPYTRDPRPLSNPPSLIKDGCTEGG